MGTLNGPLKHSWNDFQNVLVTDDDVLLIKSAGRTFLAFRKSSLSPELVARLRAAVGAQEFRTKQ